MLLKTENGRYLNTDHVVGYAALGSDSTWFIRAYLDLTTSLEGSSNNFVGLAGTYPTEGDAQAALAKLASVLVGFDPSELT